MVSPRLASEDALLELAEEGGTVLRALGRMHVDAREQSNLDNRDYVLVRFAVQVAVGAAPVSYLTTMAIGDDAGVTLDDLRGVLVAITPVVGSARVIAALENTGAAWRMAHAR